MEHQALFFSPPSRFTLALFFSVILRPVSVTGFGVNYGQIADNLPTPENAVRLVKCIGATKVKLYDADPKVLRAFANTNVELLVSIGNEYLSEVKDVSKAQDWVSRKVLPYQPATKITAIIVGNEVLSTGNPSAHPDDLFPAIQSVYKALGILNLQQQIHVTTAHSLAVLNSSYPPSSGAFRQNLVKDSICEIMEFLNETGSPFLINAYPYFAYQADPKNVRLEYALIEPNPGTTDLGSNSHYDNLLFAQIDAAYSAAAKLGYSNVCLQVSETGWPSRGDANETAATLQNARNYNGNLLKLIAQNKRTPLSPPNCGLEVFVFALFNENKKPGPTSERNYGLFNADGSPAYPLGVSHCRNANNSVSCGPVSNGSPTTPSPPSGSPWNGYMAITSDAVSILPTLESPLKICSKWLGFIVLAFPFLHTMEQILALW